MAAILPRAAHAGGATRTTVRRARAAPDDARRRRPVEAPARRASLATNYKVRVGYVREPREAEAAFAAEKAWCEHHCRGLWSLSFPGFVRHQGYETCFGFTERADAAAFELWRQERRGRREAYGQAR